MADSEVVHEGPVISEIPLTGYADALSVRAGGRIEFKVSSRIEQPYHAELVRVICGGPQSGGAWAASNRRCRPILPATIPREHKPSVPGPMPWWEGLEGLGSLSSSPCARPFGRPRPRSDRKGWRPWRGPGGERVALGLAAEGRAAIWGPGPAPLLLSAMPLRARRWVRLEAKVDLDKGSLALSVTPLEESGVPNDRQSAAGLALPSALTPTSFTVAALDGLAALASPMARSRRRRCSLVSTPMRRRCCSWISPGPWRANGWKTSGRKVLSVVW